MSEISVWRIDETRFASKAFAGEGAAMGGGRWNYEGVRVVYTSAHLAMSVLEKLVYLPTPLPSGGSFVRFRINLAGLAIKRVPISALPDDWHVYPYRPETRRIGDEWIKSRETAILEVPSALVHEEMNYVLNPTHPEFERIKVESPKPFIFPNRLLRPASPN
jgi:RES domain-containing protein